jgi:hypothetical protein
MTEIKGASALPTGLSSQATEPQASPPDGLQSLARTLSTKRVKEAYDSLVTGHGEWGRADWRVEASGEAHRTRPYPMGFYPDDPNLYYAIGWGCHEHMFPHERWLLRSAARALAVTETGTAETAKQGSVAKR